MSVNGTLVEDKMRRFKGECPHFSFNKCPIYIDDGASAKFSTDSHETYNSVRFALTAARSSADPATAAGMDLILRSIERRPQMQFSMARRFMLQLLRRYSLKFCKMRNFTLGAP